MWCCEFADTDADADWSWIYIDMRDGSVLPASVPDWPLKLLKFAEATRVGRLQFTIRLAVLCADPQFFWFCVSSVSVSHEKKISDDLTCTSGLQSKDPVSLRIESARARAVPVPCLAWMMLSPVTVTCMTCNCSRVIVIESSLNSLTLHWLQWG